MHATRASIAQARALRTLTLTLTLTLSSISALRAETLESNNPFLPPGYGEKKPEPPKPVVQNNGPLSRELEFRGIVQMDGVFQYSVYNKSEQRGYWLKEEQMEDGIQVRGYDADSRTITVSKNGRSERLTLMSASSAPLPVATSVTVAKPTNKATPNVLPPGLQNNNNSSENRRRVIPRRRVILPKK